MIVRPRCGTGKGFGSFNRSRDIDMDVRDRLKFSQMGSQQFAFYEFFAGGGMARLGLGADWHCTFSNDICEKKASAYRECFGDSELRVLDVANLTPDDLPGVPNLVWASFPCQDLSLAGNGAGLQGGRSGAFRPFWKLMRAVIRLGRIPQIIVLENVTGTLTSHQGDDFAAIVGALAQEGYRVGALVIDAKRFVPQSRPRLFLVAIHSTTSVPSDCVLPAASEPWHTSSLRVAYSGLPGRLQDSWVWWRLPVPTTPAPSLAGIIEDDPAGVDWHSKEQTQRLISLMSPLHLEKLKKAQRLGKRIVGTVYKRTRPNEDGVVAQRAEIRFDQISGCLRTPVGGSSRQTIVVVEGRQIKSRLLSPREAARLMGAPEDYPLPAKYNDAYHLFGDGVVVPVVHWLSAHLLTPLAAAPRVMIAA
jgi:DNA (cytosine-5)-methyltransferase 1